MLMPVKSNSFTHPRSLMVLHDRGMMAHATSVTGHYSFNWSHSDTGTLARVLRLWHIPLLSLPPSSLLSPYCALLRDA